MSCLSQHSVETALLRVWSDFLMATDRKQIELVGYVFCIRCKIISSKALSQAPSFMRQIDATNRHH